ncbi:MAG: hypothetical protein L6R42_004244 [Xanthoria sp. 1 TBL-2021]|nr:MAG: hypothetical protein L6R42_004244 [Xanthoria sp. 1 TBL-2021]
MQESPVILLVQGSFQSPTVYQQLTQSLQALGYVTTHPRLPSCTNTDDPDFPKTTLVDDALAVRLELIRQVEYEGKTVVVAMHSYGGLVGSEAIPEDLSYTKRRSSGLQGGVVHLFFFCAFILDKGQSVLDTFGESPTNHVHPDGRITLLDASRVLYNDLPPPEAALWASRIFPSSQAVQTTKTTRAAWRYIPSTYLVCENDQAVPPRFQETFAATIQARVERCTTEHSPMLSQPEMLARKIHEAAIKADPAARSAV